MRWSWNDSRHSLPPLSACLLLDVPDQLRPAQSVALLPDPGTVSCDHLLHLARLLLLLNVVELHRF